MPYLKYMSMFDETMHGARKPSMLKTWLQVPEVLQTGDAAQLYDDTAARDSQSSEYTNTIRFMFIIQYIRIHRAVCEKSCVLFP